MTTCDPQPLVSCITPTFERESMLTKMIKMFLKQTYSNLELIIVDDSHKPYDMKPYAIHHNIKYIRLTKRHSIGNKRNIAVNKAKGEIIAFMDDDDYHGPQRIFKQVQSMNSPCCHISLPSSIYYKRKNNKKIFTISNKLQNTIYHKGLITTCMLFRKSLFKHVKFRNINLAEDAWFIEDCKNKYKNLIVSSKVCLNEKDFLYQIHATNTWFSSLHANASKII